MILKTSGKKETLIWKGVIGFKEFHLVKGYTEDNFTLYASQSVWISEDVFLNCTKSEAFL